MIDMSAVALSCSSSNDLVSPDSVESLEWSANLPSDVMFVLLDKLYESTDHVRFAAVCKRWNFVVKDYYKHSQSRSRIPMLMFPKDFYYVCEEHIQIASLYSVSEERAYNRFQFQIPSTDKYHYERIKGDYYDAGHGWLARVVPNPTNVFSNIPKPSRSVCITLLNPFRSQGTSSIALPQFLLLERELARGTRYLNKFKVVLSADPTLNPDNYAVILLYDERELAFLTGGGKSWTRVGGEMLFSDAIFYKGRGYAIAYQGKKSGFITFDVKSSSSLQAPYVCQRQYYNYRGKAYLAESTEGDLLCVRSNDEYFVCKWFQFFVYKLGVNDEKGSVVSQVEVKSIGDDAIFIGDNSRPVSIVASKHPGCQPNCIYYAKGRYTTSLDIMIYNMEDETITQLCPQIFSKKPILLPFWITPTFSGLNAGSS